jgi:plastocyanin
MCVMKMQVMAESVLVMALGGYGCSGGSGGGYGGGSGGSPTVPSTPAATTITIVSSNGLGNLGANSFSPNPASVTQGTTVAWHNTDSTTHHIVLDNGSLDTGTIAPGATSTAMTLTVSSGTYHCTIHPTMVGSINMATTPAPMPGPGY